jgi:hypothetical protein
VLGSIRQTVSGHVNLSPGSRRVLFVIDLAEYVTPPGAEVDETGPFESRRR